MGSIGAWKVRILPRCCCVDSHQSPAHFLRLFTAPGGVLQVLSSYLTLSRHLSCSPTAPHSSPLAQ